MANDSEVSRDLARSKEIFLREPPGAAAGPPKLYDVQEEFPKTRHNRSAVVPLVIIIFLVVFVGVAVTVTYLIDRAAQRVPIGIEEFQDVNLADILDGQKRNEKALEIAKRELDDLVAEMNGKIQAIQEDADHRVELLANQPLSDDERAKNAASIRATAQTQIARIRADYEPRIQAKQREIADIQSKIDAYDSRMVAQAKKNEEALDNQQKIYEADKAQLTAYYEEKLKTLEQQREQERRELIAQKDDLVALLKKNHADEIARLTARYNPTFSEAAVTASMSRSLPAGTTMRQAAYRQTLASEGVLSQDGLGALRTYLADFSVVLKRLQAIPYSNSVPTALKRLEDLERASVNAYEDLWTSLATVVDQKNATISQRDATIRDRDATIRSQSSTIAEQEQKLDELGYAVAELTRSSRENGYILDPRNPSRMTVYMNPAIPFADGITAYVFRREDEPLATVELRRSAGTVTARLVSIAAEGATIAPFDKILVQLK